MIVYVGVGQGPRLWFRCHHSDCLCRCGSGAYVGVGLWFRCDHSDCLCRCGSGASAVVQVSSQ